MIRKGAGFGPRSRVAGRSTDTPLSAFVSTPVRTFPLDTRIEDVLLSMLEHGQHHFPVTDDSGAFIGMVTDTDLLGLARQSPFALKSKIERAQDESAAVAAALDLPTA